MEPSQPVQISSLFNKDDLIKANEFRKYSYEFQELCGENQAKFSKLIWTLPFQKGITESVLRDAIKVCERKGICTFPYLKGVLKRMLSPAK